MKENNNLITVYQLIDTIMLETIKKVEDIYKNDLQNLKKAINFINSTAKHSKNLHIMVEDSVPFEDFGDEYPHDLGGQGNKFELDILEVMMSDRVLPQNWEFGKKVFNNEELVIFHKHNKLQRHHLVPLLENPNGSDIIIWACDFILALHEERSYKPAWRWNKISNYINSYYHSNTYKSSGCQG